MTGEIIAEAGEHLTRARAQELEARGVNEAVVDLDGTLVKVFSNDMVDAKGFLPFDPAECGITEKVYFPLLRELLEQYEGDQEGLREAVSDRVDDLGPKHILVEDIMASINYLDCLAHGVGTHDDIDHLSLIHI